jgi:hypothetical protein
MVTDEKVVKSNIMLSLFLFLGLRKSFEEKIDKKALIENVKLNYYRASFLPRFLILSMTLLNKESPFAKFRVITPKILLDYSDKLFNMHTSYVLEHGIMPSHPKEEYVEKLINKDLTYDYIIIGSGPGAGITALSLPKDKSILVLEKGSGYSVDVDLKHTLANMILDFSQSGMEMVWGRKFINISQGSTLGGGSEINSGLYKTLQGGKRSRLAMSLGVSEEDFFGAEEFVEKLLNPVLDSGVKKEDSLLYRGGVIVDIPMEEVPRWRSKVDGKWVNNSIKSLIWEKNDFDIITNFAVSKIETQDKYLIVTGENLKTNSKTLYKGKKIILAAGTTSTPIILKKSNLIAAKDIRFNFAPMIRVFARVEARTLGGDDIDPFQGYNVREGFKYGSGVSTPSLLSGLMGEVVTKKDAAKIRSYYVSFLSSGKGGMFGKGSFYYNFSATDLLTAQKARLSLNHLVEAGGGEVIARGNSDLDISSVHIFGSLPYGSSIYSPNSTLLKKDNRICVIDASILPFAPEINPQALVMVISKLMIERVVRNGF